jgi:DNA-binding HxlR family transcriptional regulator
MSRRREPAAHPAPDSSAVSARRRLRQRRGRTGPEDAEPSGWCVPVAELESLIGLLVSPGILPILSELASAGRRSCPNLSAVLGPPLDDHTLSAALDQLAAFGLVVVTYTDRPTAQTPRVRCALTVSGRQLLAPLAGFATWYEHNRDQLVPDRAADGTAGLISVPLGTCRDEPCGT